jgi:mono/diheme cytochrome c family protein
MRLTPIWACFIPAMALSEAAWADGPPGQALAQGYCSACHRVSVEQARSPRVTVSTGVGTEEYEPPSFRQIAARPGRDAAYLRTFIQAPHYPMREQVFIPDELEQIVAYILSLKGSAAAEW